MVEDESFYTARRCMREPISEIFDAAALLNLATDAHLARDRSSADTLIRTANMPAIRAWTESLLGSQPQIQISRCITDFVNSLTRPAVCRSNCVFRRGCRIQQRRLLL